MNRMLLSLTALAGTSSLLLVDSTIKGAAILLLAAIVALSLRRDSAATRHLVWLVAIVAVLVVPVFSALLPQWRVLPAWAELSHESPVGTISADEQPESPVELSMPTGAESPPLPGTMEVEWPAIETPATPKPTSTITPVAVAADTSTFVSPQVKAEEAAAPSWTWQGALSLIWAVGCGVLVLRLMAARLVLWSSERRGSVLANSKHKTELDSPDAFIARAFEAACQELGIRQRVTLLLHSERSIPLVWGVIRHRLVLPTAARDWSEDQLRSVLLHELAHIRRRDTLAQLLGQLACALHWFNPLVWFAAWRLHVERERACDDLVLANGVQASTYAEHLLNVATRLTSSRWTQAVGLAMARNSALEDRLSAVLNAKRNRRSVTKVFVAASLILGAAVAIPVAMLKAANAEAAIPQEEDGKESSETDSKTKTGAGKGKEKETSTDENDSTDETDVEKTGGAPPATELSPKDKYGQAVFRNWQARARTDGKIPGALIGELAGWVRYFVELNDGAGEGGEMSKRFKELLPRFDATRDWSPIEAVSLLDAVSDIHTIPFNNSLDTASERVILTGDPLPSDLADAPWGKPSKNGLRVARILEPASKEYRLGQSIRSRILLHNSGRQTVFFVMPNWQQTSAHKATRKDGEAIQVTSTSWTTIARMAIYRLAPGYYCETATPGIGIGPRSEDEDWANVRPGSWILANAGDEVRFSPAKVEVRLSPFVFGIRKGNAFQKPKDAADLWNRFVAERVARETPIPTGAADREQLLRRLVKELYGQEATQSEIDAFVRDKSPGAMHPKLGVQLLETRVKHNRSLSPFTGTLTPGGISFRVLAADPDAAKRPRVATGPGYFTLGDQQRLRVERSRKDGRWVNSASILFFTKPRPEPHAIALPDGRGTFGIAWDRDAEVLWITHAGMVRSVNFSDPADVKTSRFEPGKVENIPDRFRNVLKPFLEQPVAPQTTRAGLELEPETVDQLQWGRPTNGLRAALIRPPAIGLPEAEQSIDFLLVVQNVSKKPIRLVANPLTPNPRRLTVRSRSKGWTLFRLREVRPSRIDSVLKPGSVAVVDMAPPDFAKGTSISRNLDLFFFADMTIEKVPPGAWTGTVVSGEMHAAFAAHGLVPKHPDARRLFEKWNQGVRWDRTIPGGLIAQLAASLRQFVEFNPTSALTSQFKKQLERLDTNRDWNAHVTVALLDEVAAIHPSPIQALLEKEIERTIVGGKPLPKELKSAPWGEGQPNGLRLAWLLDPQSKEHRLGTRLKSRILVHNTGKKDIIFRTRSWHQYPSHKATDADGNALRLSSIRSTMRTHTVPHRLRPGEFVELPAAAIGVGSREQAAKGEFVGAWINAKAGDEVTFLPATVALTDGRRNSALIGEESWWYGLVKTRLDREKPVPADDEVRRRLVYHVSLDLFGTSLAEKYTKDFLADRKPGALDRLAERLALHERLVPFTGSLKSGPTKFRVLPAAKE